MAAFELDMSEVRALAVDLTKASDEVQAKTLPVVEHGAVNIKKQMQQEMSRSKHFKQIAPTIDYDIHGGQIFGVGVIEAEIGPNKERAGGRSRGQRITGVRFNAADFRGGDGNAAPLANIAYFGSARGGGTVPDPQGALDAETPKFLKALADLTGEL